MEKSLQLIADLAKLFNWATRMNSILKAAAWLEIQMEMEQQRPGWAPKNFQGAWKLPFPGWFLGIFTTEPQFRGRGCSEPFSTGVVEDPPNPAGFFGCWCHSSHPQTPKLNPKDPHHTALPVLRDFSLRPNKPKIFLKRLKPDPNLGLICSGRKKFR